MPITTIIILIAIYLAIGCIFSFAVYDGGKHSTFTIFFYPLGIILFFLLTIIAFFSPDAAD